MTGRRRVVHFVGARLRQWAPAITACLVSVLSITARADERVWYGSVYVSRQAGIHLADWPYDIVTGKMRFKDSYFAAFGLARVLVPRFEVPLPFTGVELAGNAVEIEAQIVKHFGVQHNFEYVLAPLVRSGQISITNQIHFDVAIGDGISYTTPTYASNNLTFVNRYHIQNYLALEIEGSDDLVPDMHLVGRIHHRSGFYGLTSPSRYASNYFGLGLRYDLH